MASDAPLAPDFIRFLFSTKPKFDCHFVVGNKSQEKPERIGAVKLMLMAHSEVFRLLLEDSDLAEKGDVPVEDVHPGTFKGMLKYVYGHDTTSDLCFDEADNMLYVAEKYMIKALKDKLALRLMKLLNPDNICSLLNNPACYTHLELDSAITEILRYETDRVLASPQFLWVNTDGFLKILEQDGLAVPEIELWRAAIKWAKHRAVSEDGQLLRQQVSGFTKHLRLCTLTKDNIFEVLSSSPGVLSHEEIGAVCLSIKEKEKPKCLTEISNEIVPRKRLNVQMKQHRQQAYHSYMQKTLEMKVTSIGYCYTANNEYKFAFLTTQHSVELLPLVCQSAPHQNGLSENRTYEVNCTTTITKEAIRNNPDRSSTNEPPITVSFRERVKYGVEFEIPLTVNGKNITLLPDTKYTVEMVLNGNHWMKYKLSTNIHRNDHFSLVFPFGHGFFPSDKFQYRVSTVKNY